MILHIIFLILTLGLDRCQGKGDLLVGAFNVQVLGESKLKIPGVRSILRNIFQRYDLLLLQEIRDTVGESLARIKELANEGLGPEMPFELTVSDPLGRTLAKERYAYLYRKDRVNKVAHWIFHDKHKDNFERPPFCFMFTIRKQTFILIGAHLKPANAISEMNALAHVYESVAKDYPESIPILMGDFNADCQYVSKRSWGLTSDKVSLARKTVSAGRPDSLIPTTSKSKAPAKSNKKPRKRSKGISKKSKSLRDKDLYIPSSDDDYSDSGVDDDSRDFDGMDVDSDHCCLSDPMYEDPNDSYESNVKASKGSVSKIKPPIGNIKKEPRGKLKPSNGDFQYVKLSADPFVFLIETGVDTTVSLKKSCAFDRIVVTKDNLQFIVENSARPFYYPLHKAPYKDRAIVDAFPSPRDGSWIRNTTADLKRLCVSFNDVFQVSDHFPVEFQIKTDFKVISKKPSTPKDTPSFIRQLFGFS